MTTGIEDLMKDCTIDDVMDVEVSEDEKFLA